MMTILVSALMLDIRCALLIRDTRNFLLREEEFVRFYALAYHSLP